MIKKCSLITNLIEFPTAKIAMTFSTSQEHFSVTIMFLFTFNERIIFLIISGGERFYFDQNIWFLFTFVHIVKIDFVLLLLK